jgi:hypothetical protein
VSTSSTRFWSLIVPLTLYFPSMVKETIVTFLPFWERPKSEGPTMGNEMAVALDAASAALRNPCGVSTISSCRRSPKGTPSRWPWILQRSHSESRVTFLPHLSDSGRDDLKTPGRPSGRSRGAGAPTGVH